MIHFGIDPQLLETARESEIKLIGEAVERHVVSVAHIHAQLSGLARLPEEQVAACANIINDYAREIVFSESHRLTPMSVSERKEIAQLFRYAAMAINISSSNPETLRTYVAPMLDRARQIEVDL